MVDGVEADEYPARLTELERQKLKTKWLQEQREQRARKYKQMEKKMIYQSIEEWKQGIREVFKSKLNYSDDCANNQADAFEDMYRGDELRELPTPDECFDAEMQASQG